MAQACDGYVLCTNTLWLFSVSPLVAKARACLLAVVNGWKFCVFEGDAKIVIEACCSFPSCPWVIRALIYDVLNLSFAFLAWNFVFVHREVNVAAHSLAALALASL